jgi:hypothetical protein
MYWDGRLKRVFKTFEVTTTIAAFVFCDLFISLLEECQDAKREASDNDFYDLVCNFVISNLYCSHVFYSICYLILCTLVNLSIK